MKELRKFHEEIVDIYGYMVQVSAGVARWHGLLEAQVKAGRTTLNKAMHFGKGDPNLPGAKYQYRTSFGDLINASAKNGITSVLHRRSVIIFLVASWEDRYRSLIASECGLAKNDLQSDVFHDLNRYRQAIAHAGATLRETPKILPFFDKGDHVDLTDGNMDSIFGIVIEELNCFGKEHYGCDPEFTFDKQLN